MDDSLLTPSTPPATPPTPEDEQKKIDELDQKLPSDLEKPLPPPKPPGPPPPPPFTPPVAGPPPPPDDKPLSGDANVPPEEPEIKSPGKFNQVGKAVKKHGVKIAGGALVVTLLIGGVIVGQNLVQQRQVVEQQAKLGCDFTNNCSGCEGWAPGDGECCPVGPPDACDDPGSLICIPDPYVSECVEYPYADKCEGVKGFTGYYWRPVEFEIDPETDPRCKESPPPGGEGKHTECRNNACEIVDGSGPIECTSNADCAHPSPSPSPSASPSPSPSSSPSPQPELACVDLSTSPEENAIKLGDSVTLTCQASFSSVSPVAQFRYQVGGGAFVEDPTSFPIDTGTGQATKNITIDQTGTWLAQCRVCTDSTAASCTGWGQADGIGGPSLPPPPEPPGPPVPEQASCDLSLSAGSVSCGGGSCSGTLRWTNNVVVNIIQTNRVIAASQQPPSGSKQISARTAADLAISCQTTNGQTLDTLSLSGQFNL
ncbi:hypothetical protein A2584_01700 [Candidatus Beckwithbacteria bacterium RIFOXYD1_FULL_50_11]|nr:MAG: hypothetical protein A2584_01700 [Candidatus Beckwithbacteria bacterium RIFOXYD1_FULL_50_11]